MLANLRMQVLLVGLVVIASGFGLACNQDEPLGGAVPVRPVENSPLQTVPWVGRGGGLWERGCCGDSIWGISGGGRMEILESWKWQAGLVEEGAQFEFSQKLYNFSWIAGGRYLVVQPEGQYTSGLFARDVRSQHTLKRWKASDSKWYIRFVHSSANGKYVALASAPRGGNVPNARYTIRLLDVATLTLSDVMVLGGDRHYANNVRRVIPSDDGAYIAVAGWDNGVALIDAKQKKLFWSKRPPSAVSLTYAVFGPGNEVVYAGGGEGCVYEMAVADGKVLGRWFASPTGKSEYGHRISAIAVSPDGKYVAAGTGPAGLVFVIDPKTGKTIKVLNHGGSTVALVHFSPDSKRLASFAAGMLKVWGTEKPEQATEDPPAPPQAERKASDAKTQP